MLRALAAMFLFLVLLLPASAQRGGGMRGGGGGGGRNMMGFHGGSGSMGGFRSASPMRGWQQARTMSGMRSQTMGSRSVIVSHPRAVHMRGFPERRSGVTFGHRNDGRFFHSSRFERNFRERDFRFHHRFFYAIPFGYSGGYFGAYDDQYWNPYYSFGPYSYDPNSGVSSYTDLGNRLGEVVQELQELRDQNDSLRSELDQRQLPPAPAASSAPPSNSEPATVLVFRDGHRTEVQNYAIVGQTLWLLSDKRATKIELALLDLELTQKTNADRGITFLTGKR